MNEKPKKGGTALESFIAGLIMTIVLVVFVPIIVERYVQGLIESFVGTSTIIGITSSVIVSILMWLVILGFIFIFGGGSIFRKFGILGILGLIVAYALLDDVTGCIMPIITMIVAYVGVRALDRIIHPQRYATKI